MGICNKFGRKWITIIFSRWIIRKAVENSKSQNFFSFIPWKKIRTKIQICWRKKTKRPKRSSTLWFRGLQRLVMKSSFKSRIYLGLGYSSWVFVCRVGFYRVWVTLFSLGFSGFQIPDFITNKGYKNVIIRRDCADFFKVSSSIWISERIF